MKTLYVHIGTPKTATTSIQYFCYNNRSVLEEKGYCYPDSPYCYPTKSPRRNGLFLQGEILDAEGNRIFEEEDRVFREGLDNVRQLFQEYDSIILSDEIIWVGRRKTLWEDLKKEGEKGDFTVKVIVYLRRQDEFISSWWNQIIKQGTNQYSKTSWEDFIQNIPRYTRLNYYSTLKSIAGTIGKENIIVRRFDRNYFYGGMIESDFLHVIGLELTEEYRIEDVPCNLKLSGNTHEIKLILNKSLDLGTSDRDNRFFWGALLNCSEASGEEYPCNMFSPEEAAEFMKRYEKGNRKIVQEYLGEEDTPLFDMRFKELPKWQKDNPYMIDDVIRFVGESEVRLLQKIDALQEEIDHYEKRLSDLKYKLKHPIRTIVKKLWRKISS